MPIYLPERCWGYFVAASSSAKAVKFRSTSTSSTPSSWWVFPGLTLVLDLKLHRTENNKERQHHHELHVDLYAGHSSVLISRDGTMARSTTPPTLLLYPAIDAPHHHMQCQHGIRHYIHAHVFVLEDVQTFVCSVPTSAFSTSCPLMLAQVSRTAELALYLPFNGTSCAASPRCLFSLNLTVLLIFIAGGKYDNVMEHLPAIRCSTGLPLERDPGIPRPLADAPAFTLRRGDFVEYQSFSGSCGGRCEEARTACKHFSVNEGVMPR